MKPSNKLIVLCGLSFAGKSTLANAICTAFGHVQVDVDETKCELYGSEVADDDLEPDDWIRIYRETDEKIAMHLLNGHTVVDASRNFRRRERNHTRAIADRMGMQLVVIYVDAPEAVVRQRWARNRDQPTRRHVSKEGFEDIISKMEPPTAEEEALVFHHDESIASWLAKHAEGLA